MLKRISFLSSSLALAVASHAGERSLVDTSASPYAEMYMVDIDDVHWGQGFWGERFQVLQDSMIPYMWELFQDDYESHAWSNYLLAAGMGNGRDGHFHGPPFNDGDFLKWFEAVVNVYAVTQDPKLDELMDMIIEVVGKAQREDGYLHTKTIIPQRQGVEQAKEFADREHFETYNMGHLITAACLHHRVTGKDSMLKLAIKAADYIDGLCREVPEDLARNAICPSHYMGVMELYRVTGDEKYKELGTQMIEIRSLVPEDIGSDHNQDRVPFREMTEAVGHAVRANYLYAGVADVVAENGDSTLLDPLEKIADDVATQKLYITGMTGALYDGASPDGSKDHHSIKLVHQAYGRDYQLPNSTAYNETCATIGYNLWNWRMLTLTGESEYADLFEQTLYNGVMAGISLEGTHYFYANPLRKLERDKWPLRWPLNRAPNIKSSFCCPPNVLRTIAEVHNHVYSLAEGSLFVNLYGASELDTEWKDGQRIKLSQKTNYPWDGSVALEIEEAPKSKTSLKLRIPSWAESSSTSVSVNGEVVAENVKGGQYFELARKWKSGDVVNLEIGFEVSLYESNPLVEETLGQVAVKYGPLVYCVESNDLPEGVDIMDVALDLKTAAQGVAFSEKEIENTTVKALTLPAWNMKSPEWDESSLYRKAVASEPEAIELELVPYYAWGNRGDTDMTVWLRAK
ncbi:glycoside hydrolase family 127 protein [Pelagicoccus albus]|uniref:Glycoside hydrolase family 127 protein n=1 Tax=Pelagicoccus albus TaxID=415222 RepID=A0A7X1BBN5_9BACT|nr:beta-L-arabinofuranosidase domain-containing protein [Pelagicoccus albus]MBC2608083.1 glycoside hydrolase family 127 protein [Pelagicoccus albus]